MSGLDEGFGRALRALELDPGALGPELRARLLGLVVGSVSLEAPAEELEAVLLALLGGLAQGEEADAVRGRVATAAVLGLQGAGWEVAASIGALGELTVTLDDDGSFLEERDGELWERAESSYLELERPHACEGCERCEDFRDREAERATVLVREGAPVYVNSAGEVRLDGGILVGRAVGEARAGENVRVRLEGPAFAFSDLPLPSPQPPQEDSDA